MTVRPKGVFEQCLKRADMFQQRCHMCACAAVFLSLKGTASTCLHSQRWTLTPATCLRLTTAYSGYHPITHVVLIC